ncbi:MAG TPA: PKD domain-containing protein [Thermoplasmata archaeon]|nr:PKD domain-containing protein [Thermoplasmata archaeon]
MERGGFPRALWRRAGIAFGVWAIALSLLSVATALPGPPVAVLLADDVSPFVGEPVRFDASASHGHDAGKGRVVAYRFSFGDGAQTDWQSSAVADHAYGSAGGMEALVQVRDGRGFVDEASVEILVRDVPPPTGDAPDLEPIAASVDPARPRVDDAVTLAVTILNRGGRNATAALVALEDHRPSGAVVSLGEVSLGDALGPGATRILFSGRFLAVEEGEHTIQVVVRDVAPAETIVSNNGLAIIVDVRPPGPDGEDVDPTGGPNPVTVGLAFAAVLALGGAAAAMNRSKKAGPRDPPPPTPPSREPPPAWPP